ncbi:VanZ family protein [Rufibacter psychrotolerans]|uniref:VanZ family protein n=1 Tax=Rufibacter psychrotolerans TaxID=2812556 RepID=UPI0019686CF4|nr:VanZ family protein [Rufibacter sp. SYSU D00308]
MAVRFLHYALALGWAVVILVLTLLPPQAFPTGPDWDLLSFDSLVHALLFGVQLVLLLFGFLRDPSVRLGKRLLFSAFLLVVFFGILVEVLQGSMGLGRMADPGDALSNTIGCVLGLGAWSLYSRRF